VEYELSDFQNPKMGRILELVAKFSLEWRRELDNLDDEITSAVNSIVSNRNLIAHGQDTSVTFSMVKHWYEGVNKLIAIIYQQANPS
jgi:hypothetical protein